jgi:hypothetical protein
LPRHDVLLAERLAVESYVDSGDRSDFGDDAGVIRPYPEFGARRLAVAAMVPETLGAAPLVVTGPELTAVFRLQTSRR